MILGVTCKLHVQGKVQSLKTQQMFPHVRKAFQNYQENNFSVLIINLSDQVFADSVLHYLGVGLNHSFIDTSRHVKPTLLYIRV